MNGRVAAALHTAESVAITERSMEPDRSPGSFIDSSRFDMGREITRSNVRDLIALGLQETRGNYKIVARIFNMEQRDYKRFLNFLRKHDCQVPFKEYR